MAAWNLAGSVGAVGGPLLLAAVLVAGGTWRSAYLLLAATTGLAVAAAVVAGPSRFAALSVPAGPAAGTDPGAQAAPPAAPTEPAGEAAGPARAGDGWRPALRQALSALADGDVARWLALLQIGDLLLDVLTGYVGVYLVDVAHATPAQAAIGVAIRLGGSLAGDSVFVVMSQRVSGRVAVRITALAAAAGYPAFLLAPSLPAKLVILAALSAATQCWYPAMQAGLYGSLPGRSGVALFLSSAAGVAGAAGPLCVGFVAQEAGLSWALAALAVVPIAVLALLPRAAGDGSRRVLR